jgi:DNA-binding MarR family transcriptional regulator
VATDTEQQLKLWHIDELRRLKFTMQQRTVLLKLLDDGEVELAEIRDLIERRGWTPEQAFLSLA